MVTSHKILIAAGGTGGHIYPALAIAAALKKIEPRLEIEFVGTPHGLENKLIPREGYTLHHVAIGRLNHNVPLRERLMTVLRLPWALIQAMRLILRLKPRFVLGVGGHVTGPVVLASALLRRPAILWEPNAHPGLANRWLAPFVDRALVVFSEAGKLLRARKILTVGMPVRDAIEQVGRHTPHVGELRRPFHLLIFGGSQGSRAINNVVMEAVAAGGDWLKDVEIVHQTGTADFHRIKFRYDQVNAKVDVQEYLHDMDSRYRWADLVVARAGIGTVAELAACGKAAVLIPLPTAADNHQQRNAEALIKKEAAIMILQKEFSVERLRDLVISCKTHPETVDQLAANIRKFHQSQADLKIARYLLEAR